MIQDTFDKLYDTAGVVGVVLLILSIISVALILIKVFQFIRLSFYSEKMLGDFHKECSHKNWEDAHRTIEKRRHPTCRILEAGLSEAFDSPHLANIQAKMETEATLQFEKYSKHTRTLELIGTIAPLLGLLGTILGMIQSFKQLSDAQNIDAGLLADGIWQALSTTAMGLIVAIPAVVVATIIENKIDRLRSKSTSHGNLFLAAVARIADEKK